jgi:hypothetical protein
LIELARGELRLDRELEGIVSIVAQRGHADHRRTR